MQFRNYSRLFIKCARWIAYIKKFSLIKSEALGWDDLKCDSLAQDREK